MGAEVKSRDIGFTNLSYREGGGSLSREDALQRARATTTCVLAWRILWMILQWLQSRVSNDTTETMHKR